jgi:histidinol dehydrogenase
LLDRINKIELVKRLARRSVVFDQELMSVVGAIVEDVRVRGDEALIEYTARFDKVELNTLRVSEEELRSCAARADERVRGALREAIANVRDFHERQVERSWTLNPREGVQLGQRITPLERVGFVCAGRNGCVSVVGGDERCARTSRRCRADCRCDATAHVV